MTTMMKSTIRPKQLNGLLRNTVLAGLPVLITGAPGIGKTDIVKQVAGELGYDTIVAHPAVSDPTDYKGLPMAIEGKADFLPFGELDRLINATEPTIYFIDDLGQAPPAVQKALMQLILARQVNNHKISDKVVFIAATNRKEDRAGVTGILEPVKSRFAAIVELQPNLDDWVEWAWKNDIEPVLIGFVKFRPNLLFDFKPTSDIVNTSCPRTVANLDKLLKLNMDDAIALTAYTGAVGEGFANEFYGFLKIYESLPDVDMILKNPKNAHLDTEPNVMYALATALANRANKETFDAIIDVANRKDIAPEFSVLIVMTALEKYFKGVNHSKYTQWALEHKDYMNHS